MSRYQRLLDLSSFSFNKLKRLQSKKVLLIGVGGVGEYVATSLVTNGVEHLTIVDFDKVEISNLNRQILLEEKDQGKIKVEVVQKALKNRNEDAEILCINQRVDSNNIASIIASFDLVIDAVDNWESKLVISKECYQQHKPLLHIGVDGDKGQWCLFVKKSLLDIVDDKVVSSKKDGVIGPSVGAIASLASVDVIRYLCKDQVEIDTLFYYDFLSHHLGKMKI